MRLRRSESESNLCKQRLDKKIVHTEAKKIKTSSFTTGSFTRTFLNEHLREEWPMKYI